MQVKLNDKTTKELKECLAILALATDAGDRLSHADANASAVASYPKELGRRYPDASAQVSKPKK